MLLEEKEELVLAKLIGFLNGIEGEGINNNEESIIFEIMDALVNNKNLDYYVGVLIELKKSYLPNCLTCMSPCGRSDDYHINKQDIDKRNEKINKYYELKNRYKSGIKYNELVYEISKLGW